MTCVACAEAHSSVLHFGAAPDTSYGEVMVGVQGVVGLMTSCAICNLIRSLPHRKGSKMKKMIAGLIVIAAIVAAYFGYQRYQASEFVKALHSPVKEVTLRTKSLLDDTDNPGQMTYRDFAEKADAAIKNADETLLKVESMDTSINPEAANAAISYIKQARAVSRSLRAVNQADMKSNNALERYKNAVDGFKTTSNRYSYEYAKERADTARKEAEEAVASFTEADENAKSVVQSFIQANTDAGEQLPVDLLMPKDVIERAKTLFSKEEKKENKAEEQKS